MSYMIETDVPVCVFICLDVYVGFQDQKLVKNKQKLADSPLNSKNQFMVP